VPSKSTLVQRARSRRIFRQLASRLPEVAPGPASRSAWVSYGGHGGTFVNGSRWELVVSKSMGSSTAMTHFRTTAVDGIDIFYREAGSPDAPAVLLLHGFPTSSRMYRNLIP
jgi:hypothetical protein